MLISCFFVTFCALWGILYIGVAWSAENQQGFGECRYPQRRDA